MSTAWNLNLGDQTAGELDARNSHLPDAYYRAKCEAMKINAENGNLELTFAVSHGPYAGRRKNVFLNNPELATNQEMAARRAALFAARLGLIPKDAKGNQAVDWSFAVGKEVILQLESRSYTDREGKNKNVQDVTFAGIWPLDHVDLTNDLRRGLGLPEIPGLDPVTKQGRAAAGGAKGKAAAAPAQTPEQVKAASDATAAAIWGN